MNATLKTEIAENNYEEFIDEELQWTEERQREKKNHRKTLLKRDQKESFVEVSI